MSKTNYKLKLKNALRKLATTELTDEFTKLSPKDEKRLLAGKETLATIHEAIDLMSTDVDKAFELLCDLPYYMINPGEGVSEKRKTKETLHVGSHELYCFTDTIRHYIRMLDLESGEEIGSSPIWNNILVLRG